jgi:hypothetical protein
MTTKVGRILKKKYNQNHPFKKIKSRFEHVRATQISFVESV